MELCYLSQPNLLVDRYCVKSCCGVQQGDPLGPLGLALALHPIIKQISEEVPSSELNVWYLDDGTLCGSRSELLKALNILELEGPRRGLHLNQDKCLLFVPPGDYNSNDGFGNIPIVQDGFVLLGSPVGSPSFIASHASAKVEEVKKLISFLPDLKDSHMQFCLLHSCLSLPKLTFLLCTCPPNLIQDASLTFDQVICQVVEDIVGCPLSFWAWKKASLPVSLGRVRNSKNELLKNQLTVFFPEITFNHKLQDQVSALKTLSLN